MPRAKKIKEEPIVWQPDFTRVLEIKNGVAFIGGNPVDPITLENLKNEASMIKTGVLFQTLGSTLEAFAVELALKKVSINESADIRSTKLAYAQAFSDWNTRLWTSITLLSRM